MGVQPGRGAGRQASCHLLLYDGVCGLCNGLVQFVLARDPQGAFRFASLQGSTGRTTVERSGGNPDDLSTFYAIADHGTPRERLLVKSRAGLFVLDALGWPWKAATLVGLLPTALLDRLYDVIARHRYRLFGRFETCVIPRPEFRDRFLD